MCVAEGPQLLATNYDNDNDNNNRLSSNYNQAVNYNQLDSLHPTRSGARET